MRAKPKPLKSEVSTDGRTVWVNNPFCVARFCPQGGEVDWDYVELPLMTLESWRSWQLVVLKRYGIVVDDGFMPIFIMVQG